ncbi:MAG: TadE/TadG family type IV pilus assembly protein [Hyphomicrobium sp.]
MRVLLTRLGRDQSGAAMVEFTIVVFFFLVLTGGVVEFALGWYQWNSASKALQQGVRLASVSDPVASDLINMTGLEGSAIPGDPMPSFLRVCNGATQTCTNGGTYSTSAMNTIVYGRGQTTCGTFGPDGFAGMCDIFDRIQPQNVIITYQHTGLGFAGRPGAAGRPGGAVPTITIELIDLEYNYAFLSGLLGLGPITLPPMRTTATGEDLATIADGT